MGAVIESNKGIRRTRKKKKIPVITVHASKVGTREVTEGDVNREAEDGGMETQEARVVWHVACRRAPRIKKWGRGNTRR